MIAGGIGGTTGDLVMHSLDTVKTRQQGDMHIPPRYTSMSSSYATIFRQEGFRRGLYSGVTPAFLGSFPGTIIFFGTYEYSKRHLIDKGVHHSLAYLAGGQWTSVDSYLLPNLSLQASSPTSPLPSSTFHPKSSKPVSNSKGVTTIPFFSRATTIAQQSMRLVPSFAKRASLRYFTVTRRPYSATYLSRLCSSHFMNRSKNGPDNGSVAGTSDSGLKYLLVQQRVAWQA